MSFFKEQGRAALFSGWLQEALVSFQPDKGLHMQTTRGGFAAGENQGPHIVPSLSSRLFHISSGAFLLVPRMAPNVLDLASNPCNIFLQFQQILQ